MESINNDIDFDTSEDEGSGRRTDGRPGRMIDKSWGIYLYTIAMFFNHFAYGVNYSLIGPTLVDLKYMFNTTMSWISFSLVIGNIGYLSGSLFGLVYNYINRQITLLLLVFGMSASVALIPFCPNVWMFYICQFFNGVGAGAWDNGNNVWLVEMWPQKSLAVMQFSQFMYGLGTVLAPVLVKPYLTGENSTHHKASHDLLNDWTPNTTNPAIDRRELLETPFIITGLLQGLVPIVFLIMFFTNRYINPNEKRLKRKDSSESLISASDQQNSAEVYVRADSPIPRIYSRRVEKLLIALFAIFLSIYCSLEIQHFNYSSTYYQFIPLHISAQNAAEILSVMSTTYTIGRCVSAFVGLRVGPKIMIIYHLFIIIIAMAVLYYGQHSLTLIWIGNIIIGFGFSAMYSSIIALTANHVTLTDSVSTIMVFGNGVFGAVTPFVLGPLIEIYPKAFIQLEVVYLSLSALLFLVIVSITERSARIEHHLL